MSGTLSRRALLSVGGGLLLAFRLRAAEPEKTLPGSLATNPELDAWIRIAATGAVTLLTGKVELGQGVLTALAQILADELDIDLEAISVISGDTALSPNEGPTAGSLSMPSSGTAMRFAAAETRQVLIELAAMRLGVAGSTLRTERGLVIAEDGARLSYGDLLGGKALRRRATGSVPPRGERRHIGSSTPRLDLPAKVTGKPIFLHDYRPTELAHARILRPPAYGARLLEFDASAAAAMPGVVKVVRDGDFVAVIAERERQAARAIKVLAKAAHWSASAVGPSHETIHDWLKSWPAEDIRIVDKPQTRAAAKVVEATYRRPFLMHGSIGPSVAVGLFENGRYTIHTHSQSVFETAAAIVQMLGVADGDVRLIHVQGSGCYGHNGADDAAAEAALLARALPGRPVRVQWSRQDEHVWEPYGSAMQIELAASVDTGGDVIDWRCDLWSMPHSSRPGGVAGNLLPARMLAKPFPLPPAKVIPAPSYGPDRNAIPYYDFAGQRVTTHFVRDSPVRVSSLRSLGAHANIFAIESLMDQLAHDAQVDPIAYRLRHLKDPRASEVLTRTAEAFGWASFARLPGRGRGVAFARYKNLAAYCAVCLEVEVDLVEGAVRVVRAVAGVDAGAVVNPDGLRNQIEGGLLQSLSWSLKEEVRFGGGKVLSDSWAQYPILSFSEAPPVEVVVIDRPDALFLGAGEASQGPTPGALANAIFDASGLRLRAMPFTPARVRAGAGDQARKG